MPSASRDDNRVPSLVAKSDADNSPIVVEADGVTKRLKVNATLTGTINASVATTNVPITGATTALASAIVDGSGNQISSFGGGTQYAEDTAHVSGDTMTLAGVVQKSADAALSDDGDRSLLQVDSSGFLKVNVKAGAAAGGTSSSFGSANPANGTAAGFSDGTNLQEARVYDLDTGAGTEYGLGIGVRVPASGGSVAVTGDATNGLDVDVTRPPADLSASGTLGINGATVTLNLQGASSVWFSLVGALTMTVQFEGTIDGSTYFSIMTSQIAGNGAVNSQSVSTSQSGYSHFPGAGGLSAVRMRVSAYTSGTPTGTIRASASAVQFPYPQISASTSGDGTSNPIVTAVPLNASVPILINGANADRGRTIANAINSTGTGIAAVGNLAQFDDVSPTAITENQFGNLRMSTNRNLYGTIRDAAGNERGVNVTASNALTVDASATTQPISAASLPLPSTAATSTKQSDGSQKTQVVDGSGNIIGATANALDVNIKSGASAGTQYTEDVAAAADPIGNMMVGVRRDTLSTTEVSADGDNIALKATNKGQLHVKLADTVVVDASGTAVPITDNSGSITVDGTFWQATQPVSGTVTANMGTVTADPFGANADAASAAGSISAKLRFIASTGIPITGTVTVGSHAVTNAGTFAVQSADAGDVASGSSDSGNPVKLGGQARTTNPTAVTDGQRVNGIFDKLGKQVVVNSVRDLKGVQQTTITSSTSETTIITSVASTFLDLYGLIITNTSGTVTKVTIKDATAGTTRAVIEVPATETRGFMLTESAAIPQAAVTNNWTATCGTSVASVEITALYVKNV